MNATKVRTSYGMLAVLLSTLVIGNVTRARAQLSVPPTTLSYSFSVPVALVVPNACTEGFVLLEGTINVAIATDQGGTDPFKLAVTYRSSGTGRDVLSSALALGGAEKPEYVYSSETVMDAGFPAVPEEFGGTIGIRDYLMRADGDKSDQLLIQSVFDLSFTNGVPSAPVLTEIGVSCAAR
jgi:hypothetical protein